MIEAGLYNLVTTDTAMAALIGNRMYPVFLAETSIFPCLSYQVVSSTAQYTFDRKAFTQSRIQFDCWSTTYAECKAVNQALNNVLDTYTGTLNENTKILSCLSSISSDLWESDSRLFRILSEFTFQYVEA